MRDLRLQLVNGLHLDLNSATPVYSLIGWVTMHYLVYSETRLFLCVSFGNAIQAAESAAKIRYNTSSLGIGV